MEYTKTQKDICRVCNKRPNCRWLSINKLCNRCIYEARGAEWAKLRLVHPPTSENLTADELLHQLHGADNAILKIAKALSTCPANIAQLLGDHPEKIEAELRIIFYGSRPDLVTK